MGRVILLHRNFNIFDPLINSDATGGLLRGVQAPPLKGDRSEATPEGRGSTSSPSFVEPSCAKSKESPYGQDSARAPYKSLWDSMGRAIASAYLVFCLFLIIGYGSYASAEVRELEAAEAKDRETDEEADQKILSFNLIGYAEGGQKKWEVEGRSADIFSEIVQLSQVVARAYGEEEATLSADKGTYDKSKGKLHLQDNVVATTQSGARLTTDSLDWEADSDLVETEDYVTVENGNIASTGKGGQAQTNLKMVELKKEVTVKIKPSTVITCEGPLEVDYGNNIATFNNDVVVTDQQGKIYSDKMIVYFDFKSKKINRIIAQGNVRIAQGRSSTYSQEATYIASERKIILTGQPKLLIYPEEGESLGALIGD